MFQQSSSSRGLGELVVLNVQVGKTGPSTIENSTLEIRFPQSNESLNYFLYPRRITVQHRVSMINYTKIMFGCFCIGVSPLEIN